MINFLLPLCLSFIRQLDTLSNLKSVHDMLDPLQFAKKGKEGSGGRYSYSVKSYTDAPGRKYKRAFHRISFVFTCIQSCYGRNVLI